MEEKQLVNNTVKELSDEELKNVVGGSNLTLHFFNTAEEVRFIFSSGDIVYVKENIFSKTVCCTVVRREVFNDPQYNCYEDMYIVRDPDGLLRRVLRDDIVNQAD